jgi:transcriptional antiterminator
MRDKIEFNLESLESLCRLNCTLDEIAAYFNVSVKTVERRYKEEDDFAAAVDRGKAHGRLSLRRKQLELVDKGNASMAKPRFLRANLRPDKNDCLAAL